MTAEYRCPSDHQHGASNNCYGHHGCRCAVCRRKNADLAARRRRRIAYGTLRTMVPTAGVRRRLQALAYAGWSISQLSKRSGLVRNALHYVMVSESTFPRVYDRVVSLYDELWDKQPPQSTAGEKGSVVKTKKWARANGWHPALAWDDDTIDDPDVQPATADVETAVDGMAVEMAVHGDHPKLTPTERRMAIPRLHALRWSDSRIASWIDVNIRTVERIRDELHLPAWDLNEQDKAA